MTPDQFLKTLSDDRSRSLRQLVVDFFGTGMIVDDFRQGGIMNWDRDWLKMWVKTSSSWSAQSLNTLTVTPSGPAAFLEFTTNGVHITSCACTVRVEY